MKDRIELSRMFVDGATEYRLSLLSWLILGIVESLANGVLGVNEAVRILFHADNCLFVRKTLRDRTADEIMSRGVQLPDLFEALPEDEARREFQQELGTLRALCLKLLNRLRVAA